MMLKTFPKTEITAGIVTYNNRETIRKAVETCLKEAAGLSFRLIIFDNASTDGTPDLIEEAFPEVIVIRSEKNLGFGRGHNAIISRVRSRYHFVVNPDIEAADNVFRRLADLLEANPKAGLVTPRILNPDGTEQAIPKFGPSIRFSIIEKFPGFHWLRTKYTRSNETFTKPTEIQFCTGCFFAGRTKDLYDWKGFSHKYFMYCEDSDLSKRVLTSGRTILFDPNVHVFHKWNRDNTRNMKGVMQFMKSLLIYFKTWGVQF